ncbi:MAG: hypothetical protein QM478_00200 [Flavobacteriaceae bacterium]
MKHSIKFLTVLVAVFSFTIVTTYAQQGINYKAIISDNGAVVQNQAVQVQFSILRDGTSVEYQETQSTTTDANGIIILNIGEGTVVSGSYGSIHWYAPQFLKVEIDTGSGYVDFGTTEFKTVPYAIYAENGNGAKKINDLTDAKKDVTSIFLGSESGSLDEGNTDNTAVGNFALRDNTSGTSNNAIGFAALHVNTTGSANIANGASSLASNTSGSNNIAIGVYALTENITGSNNTALGRNAGYNSLGNNNIFLGYEAGYNETGSNKLYIENSNSATPLIGGDFSTDEVTINGSIAIVDGTQGAGKILISDANGKASWVVPVTGATELNSLTDAITGGYSTFIGNGAGVNDDGGNHYNTGIGNNILHNNTTGHNNTANGASPLFYNTEGYHNTANGSVALYSNTTGNSNTANGVYSLNMNTIGSSNTASGHSSLRNIIGDNNTALGANAGFLNEIGSGNIFLGYSAGYFETGSNKLYIENSNSTTPLIGGDFSTNEVTINGSIAIVDGTEGVDKVLTSDVNGKASWVVPVTGATILNDLSDAKTGGYSTFIGYGTGINDDGSSNDNTGIGYQALYTNTTGYNNVANGVYSLYRNTTGGENVANGHRSLRDNTTGSFNVAYGDQSLQGNTTGGSNTANGYHSLHNNITGSNNTAIGYQSGYNAIGVGNIFLGNSSGYNETGDNKLYIENTDSATPLIGGDFSTDEVTINGTLNVTGNITANLTGDVTGDVTGNVIGNITGDVTGNITGDVNGRIMAANSGTADMKAYIYGSLYSSGGLKTGPSSNGFTSAKVATGHYRITFDTNPGSEEAYMLIASVSNTSLPQIITYYQSSSYFDVYVWDISGNNVDAIFNFVVYKK